MMFVIHPVYQEATAVKSWRMRYDRSQTRQPEPLRVIPELWHSKAYFGEMSPKK